MSARSLINMRTLRASSSALSRAQFSTSSRFALKESSSQTGTDYEKHKQDSLEKQKKGNAHWKPELASDSEEALKADRHSKDDPQTLAEKTKHAANEASKSGTSTKDHM
ncbi:hypothetical protein CC79DRAFT_1371534 [Sarocladium strictum]